MRCDTPDNRRTMDLHIKIHAHISGCSTEDQGAFTNAEDIAGDVAQDKNAQDAEAVADPLDALDLDLFIEDPQYSFDVILGADLSKKKRINIVGKPWQTRFMNITKPRNTNKSPSVVNAVRTHLRFVCVFLIVFGLCSNHY